MTEQQSGYQEKEKSPERDAGGFLQFILFFRNGQLSRQLVEAWYQAKFTKVRERSVLCDTDGKPCDSGNGGYIDEEQVNIRFLTSETRSALLKLVDVIETNTRRKTQNSSEIATFKALLGKVSTGQISGSVLESWINPTYDEKGQVYGPGGQPIQLDSNTPLTRQYIEANILTKEGADLLLAIEQEKTLVEASLNLTLVLLNEIGEFLRDKNPTQDEIQSFLSQLQTASTPEKIQLYTTLFSAKDGSDGFKTLSQLGEINGYLLCSLRVFQGIKESQTENELRGVLESYKPESQAGIQNKQFLTNRVNQYVQLKYINESILFCERFPQRPEKQEYFDTGVITFFERLLLEKDTVGKCQAILKSLAVENKVTLETRLRRTRFLNANPKIPTNFNGQILDTIKFALEFSRTIAHFELKEFIRATRSAIKDASSSSLQNTLAEIQAALRTYPDNPQLLELAATCEKIQSGPQNPENIARNRTVALGMIKARFIRCVYPLIQFLRANPGTKEHADRLLGRSKDGSYMLQVHQLRLAMVREQRELSPDEMRFFETVDLLSVFNPYLIACAQIDPDTTRAVLEHHFRSKSKETTSQFANGNYYPAIQIGLGPNGIASLGEMLRTNPSLTQSILVVDSAAQPGGPFATSDGSAFALNSANAMGRVTGAVHDKDPDFLQCIRGDDPFTFYPGERTAASPDARVGSINNPVPALPAPDLVNQSQRYLTNQELQLMLALQASLLTNHVAFGTRVVSVMPAMDNEKGNKIVTLEVREEGRTTKTFIVRTDAIIVSSGLGKPNYGFDLDNTNAGKIIRDSKNSGETPRIISTLEAYSLLIKSEQLEKPNGVTLAIWGGGDSAITLIENLGRLFRDGKASTVRKIYLITDMPISERPRYAQVKDLFPRKGLSGEGIVEIVSTRVTDVNFASDTSPDKLVLYNPDGSIITDARGDVIQVDYAVSACGFQNGNEELFESYIEPSNSGGDALNTEPILYKELPVGAKLAADGSVIFVGTTVPYQGFEEKLLQYPVRTQEVIQRISQNLVAIGFRAPEVRRAVEQFLNDNPTLPDSAEPDRRIKSIPVTTQASEMRPNESYIQFGTTSKPKFLHSQRIASSLISYAYGTNVQIVDKENQLFSGDLQFTITTDTSQLIISPTNAISHDFRIYLLGVLFDVLPYLNTLLSQKRTEKKLTLALSFKFGRINPSETFVE